MSAPHLFAIDIDGTLLNTADVITPRTLAAVSAIRAAGHRVAIATGRMASSSLPIAQKLGLDDGPIICMNGSDLVDPLTGASIEVQPLAADALSRLVMRLQESDAEFFMLGHRLAVSQTRQYGSYDTILTRSLASYLERPVEPVLKATIACPTLTLQAQLFTELSAWRAFDLTRSLDGNIYLTAYEVTKLSGIQALCRRFDIPLARVTAFGNAENDLDMLLHVGCGIAMANSDPVILDRIPRHTRSNDEDGVAYELERFLAEAAVASQKS